ncbi:MAG TPA: Rieske 2Fe-2S domain-containing protein [Chloroflexota bacterium]
MARSGFLRGFGALTGATALGALAGPLVPLFSPGAGALAAGKPKTTAAGTGLWLGNAGGLTPARALAYTDPGSGDPALLLRLANGQYVSFDAGCTHGTCTVAYDTRRRLMVCPCHGATFDPAHGAAVLVGPAKDPLYQLPVRVDALGDVYYLAARPGPRINRLTKAPPYTGQTGDDSGAGGVAGGHGGEGDDTQVRPLSRRVSAPRIASRRVARAKVSEE